MTRVAAIDCGTNSIRVLVADIDAAGALTDVLRRMEIVRLGQGVDTTGRIAPESMERTLRVAHEYAAQCRELGAERVRFVATSASRDADNSADFQAGVRKAFGDLDVSPEVISGDEEASLSFSGATGDLRTDGVDAPYLVIDLGGGSTEFVLGTDHVERARSVRMGCVRFTERHLHSDPPSTTEIAAAEADIHAAIDKAADVVPLDQVGTLIGLAGSVTTITAYALGLSRYDSERIHGSALSVSQVVAACEGLLHATRAERAALGFMHPGRVDVIGSGALIWRCIVQRVAAESGIERVVSSEKDILDGIARSLVVP
ncbi:Ppx/GppA phosphatase family protein [Leekyejoonella antrihumi]|uniref:Ppx/GppA family phosphatase n=1 Tax=Leekyejoonella antrihumi TaxID=1660198 RepID=A0A563DT82_9MICO|nr:Ppx/GppA phosphatase family protein [Leekyejoonella antrihumi]TWP33467.1 Ppx/GppA family phosphatase [Leekyejoonella antrihumi]